MFVGVGIETDVEKLLYDYNLGVANAVDPRVNAVRLGYPALRNAGLKECARVLLGFDFQKPKGVTMSRWDNQWLYNDQVQYACIDAFVSRQIAIALQI